MFPPLQMKFIHICLLAFYGLPKASMKEILPLKYQCCGSLQLQTRLQRHLSIFKPFQYTPDIVIPLIIT